MTEKLEMLKKYLAMLLAEVEKTKKEIEEAKLIKEFEQILFKIRALLHFVYFYKT